MISPVHFIIFIPLLFFSFKLSAQRNAESINRSYPDTSVYNAGTPYELWFAKPKPFMWIKNYIPDNKEFFKATVTKKGLITLGVVAASTTAMIFYDQTILDETQRFGRKIGIPGDNKQVAIIDFSFNYKGDEIPLPVYVPANLNTAMYFLGDGLFHIGLVGGIWGYGKINHDNRAKQTASQMVEAMLGAGMMIQVIKHITGRESPFTADTRGGVWRFFPNQLEYARNVPNYDAFPTGHLAATLAALTVVSENYPEKRWIKPVGIGLCTMLGFSMVNNGVHWISDYPLGMVIGYGFAKIAVRKGRISPPVFADKIPGSMESSKKKVQLFPLMNPVNKTAGVILSF